VTTDSPKRLPPEATASPELPEHISQNIADIVQLQHRHAGALSTAQRRLERMGRFFSRPRYLVGLFFLIGAWISYNLAAPGGVGSRLMGRRFPGWKVR
jgi:uncharacterized membrane protein